MLDGVKAGSIKAGGIKVQIGGGCGRVGYTNPYVGGEGAVLSLPAWGRRQRLY